ncbi:translation initiation factor IF-2 [Terricaulis sp.]|uniref:translation initiation factor IF-2 n=1 Tax=Terricaulis sp. TaxID=2768686 RepID=UPI002AC43550|nr:translation initiation factor IF-2 [Terricaulis sp.]MDZ4693397.1 translation initiation factor IF-2 [Terricaulis sp.]
MSDGNEQKDAPSGRKPLTLTRTASAGTVRQSFSHGRTKQVAVEVREKRSINRPGAGGAGAAAPGPGVPPPLRSTRSATPAPEAAAPKPQPQLGGISDEEARRRDEAVRRSLAEREAREERQRADDESRRALEDAQRRKAAEDEALAAESDARRRAEQEEVAAAAEPATEQRPAAAAGAAAPRPGAPPQRNEAGLLDELGGRIKSARKPIAAVPVKPAKKGEPERRKGKLTLDMVEREVAGDDDRVRSLAAYRRAQQKEKERRAKMMGGSGEREQIKREVIIPESITVQELSNRMAVRVADIIKFMMHQGQMLKQSDELDADTAELIATELGHTVKRVAESDVEEGLEGDITDTDENLLPRPPVVTIMGHVDHGKTSLLDALRQTDVAAGEAGGITQHIGAYQVRVKSGERVTFLDTPGHAAFTAMRARGAQVTDIVVLVVAADDGVMPQTVEAINHAKASGAPIIIAINKIDKEDANPTRVLTDLLKHEIVTEAHGGDTLAVEVSAKQKLNLDKLVETILLQSEVLDLKANPDRPAEATVIESKLDRGRGTVATVLVQKGTLKRGDIVVVGAQMGRVRALTNERGQQLQSAGPSEPVEIMGLEGVPDPGDTLNVVENENRAREVADYRARAKKLRTTGGGGQVRTSLESMMAKFKDSTAKELPILIKADVQGSAEAIVGSLDKLAHEEVRARVVLSGVGAINESDVQLAKGSGAPIIGFNVRASKEARDLAEREGVEIRYYAIIYDLIDDIKGVMSGMLAPQMRETFLGNAAVLEVFNISKVGKVAGCRVTDGVVRKGAKVRILRDNVVIQEMGVLSTLKRFKDEVDQVVSGQECGMSFGPFQDIKQGDVIECFNVEVVQRSL